MDLSLDTFLLIVIGTILWTMMRANEKSHEQTRNMLQFLLETNTKTEETIKSIDRAIEDKWYRKTT